MPSKRCSGCGCHWPATPEYFSRDASSPDGYFHRCTICEGERASINYLNNGDKIRAEARERYYADHEASKAYYRDYRQRKRAAASA